MAEVEDFSVTDAGNGTGSFAVAPPGFPEHMTEDKYNDSMRAFIASVRRMLDSFEYKDLNRGNTVTRISGTQLRISGIDLSGIYVVGRRVRWRTGAGSFSNGRVTAVVFSTDTTVTVSGVVAIGADDLEAYTLASIRSAALLETGTGVGEIPVNTVAAVLGSAAYKNSSTAIGDVPVNVVAAVLGTAAYKTQSNTTGDVPVHSQTGPLAALAYRAVPFFGTNVLSADAAYTASAEVLAIAQLALTGADGVKKFEINVALYFANGGTTADCVVSIHLGNAGTIGSDPVVAEIPLTITGGNSAVITLPGLVLTPAALDKVTIGFAANHNGTIVGTGLRRSRFTAREVL